MASSLREALDRKLSDLSEPNRFASLILSCGEKTMYLDAVFCSQEFGLIRKAMKDEEEKEVAMEADNVIPVCRIDLIKLGLTEKRVNAVVECIALTYMVIPLFECLTKNAPGFEKCNEELAQLFHELYPLVDGPQEEEKKENPIITMWNFLDAARWMDAKQLLIQVDNSISKCIKCNHHYHSGSFDLNNLDHTKLSEAVALADEFALSRSWSSAQEMVTSNHHTKSPRCHGYDYDYYDFNNDINASCSGPIFVKKMLTIESSPASRIKLESKFQLLLCLI